MSSGSQPADVSPAVVARRSANSLSFLTASVSGSAVSTQSDPRPRKICSGVSVNGAADAEAGTSRSEPSASRQSRDSTAPTLCEASLSASGTSVYPGKAGRPAERPDLVRDPSGRRRKRGARAVRRRRRRAPRGRARPRCPRRSPPPVRRSRGRPRTVGSARWDARGERHERGPDPPWPTIAAACGITSAWETQRSTRTEAGSGPSSAGSRWSPIVTRTRTGSVASAWMTSR